MRVCLLETNLSKYNKLKLAKNTSLTNLFSVDVRTPQQENFLKESILVINTVLERICDECNNLQL